MGGGDQEYLEGLGISGFCSPVVFYLIENTKERPRKDNNLETCFIFPRFVDNKRHVIYVNSQHDR